MNRLFIDANILLDALLQREENATDAIELLALGAQRKVRLLTTAISVGVVLYQLQRSDADKKGIRLKSAQLILTELLLCVELVSVEAEHFLQSISSTFGDLEDGAQYFAVSSVGKLHGVVSRAPDFDGHIGVKRLSAKQALQLIKKK